MGQHRRLRSCDLLNRLDLVVRDRRQPIPPFSQYPDETPSFLDFDVSELVHRMAQKEVPWKHRSSYEMPASIAPRPGLNLGEKHLKTLHQQLIVDLLLAMALSPEDMPLLISWVRLPTALSGRSMADFKFLLAHQQGFAPFG